MAIEAHGVAVVGCGLIGTRRAAEAAAHHNTRLIAVVDPNQSSAKQLAEQFNCESIVNWTEILDRSDIQIVVVATPNGFSKAITCASLEAGKHVLVEKPMGRNLDEAQAMAQCARQSQRLLKIGFNHRYHPAISRAHELVKAGKIGELINLRARYGHGGRPGYEKEWRGNPAIAGGGELTDQGVHVADLFHWFAGIPQQAFAMLQTAVWPLGELEDNAFGLFQFDNGVIGSFHTSWTQWKNLFSVEIFGRLGSLSIEGLGKSYGLEQLRIAIRKPAGGAPDIEDLVYEGPDESWALEWADFIAGVDDGSTYLGTPVDGLSAMSMLAALYQSAKTGALVPVRHATQRGLAESQI